MRLTRRKFVQSILGAGAAAGLPFAFSGCSRSSKASTATATSASAHPFVPSSEFTFPKGFFWGTATTPGKIKNGDTGDIACDSYHRWREAIVLMRAMNQNSYRFSISWPRIQPSGSGTANSKGVDYYSRLVDALLEARIRPLVTLYHWELPQPLEDARGWPNRDTAGRFADYVQLVARALGDRVNDWIIFNEPDAFVDLGYLAGTHAPGRTSLLDFLRATHVVNLAQGAGFRALKAVRPAARVGTAFQHVSVRTGHRFRGRQARSRSRLRHDQHLVSGTGAARALSGRAYRSCPKPPCESKAGDMETMRAPLDFHRRQSLLPHHRLCPGGRWSAPRTRRIGFFP